MRLSGADLAGIIGCDPSTLSRAKERGALVYGQWPISAWAVHDASGRLEYYDVPDDSALLSDVNTERGEPDDAQGDLFAPSDLEEAASAILTKDQIREIIRSEIPRENPKPEKQDYMRPAAAGGLSYAMARAVERDSGTARAAVITAGAIIGAMVGQDAADHWSGALVGAILAGGLGWQAMRSSAADATPTDTEAPTPTADDAHAGMATEESGKDFHIPDAHAGTHGQPIRAVG